MSGEICDRGWAGKSVKDHVETANNTAETADEVAEQNAREIESINARLAKLEGADNE